MAQKLVITFWKKRKKNPGCVTFLGTPRLSLLAQNREKSRNFRQNLKKVGFFGVCFSTLFLELFKNFQKFSELIEASGGVSENESKIRSKFLNFFLKLPSYPPV